MADTHRNNWSDPDVEAHWDKVASVYVKENNKVKKAHDQRFIETVRHLDLTPGCRILNITSRDAEANDYILKYEPSAVVVNAEISAGLIKVAATLRPEAVQVKISAYSDLPFDGYEFNRIVCLETLEHVEDPVAFLKELYRVSKPDALMVLSCPPATSEIPYQIFTFLFGGHGEGPHRFLSSKEVKTLLQQTGWKLKMHKGSVLLPVGPAAVQNLAEQLINRFQGTFIAEMGIRQFYVCTKY
ncbi:MAG: methyltransferase domain-containing protein [Bacteroidota bacterium]